MSEGGESAHNSALLSASWGAGGDKNSSVLAPVASGGPLSASGVPEGLPLSWEVAISSWDTYEEGIVLLEGLGVNERDVGFRGSMHLERKQVSHAKGLPIVKRQILRSCKCSV